MNGLKYIRTRCNFSLSELAERLDVSRQIISKWESEEKAIPPQRKKQLSDFFGISEEYFGNINEEQKKYLLEKAMFRYIEDGKETYKYKGQSGLTEPPRVIFLPDSELSLDEKFSLAQENKKKLLNRISDIMLYDKSMTGIQNFLVAINRGAAVYSKLSDIMDFQKKQKILHKMPYFYVVLDVLNAMAIGLEVDNTAYFSQIEDDEERQELEELSEMIKSIYEKRKKCINQDDAKKDLARRKKANEELHKLPEKEAIAQIESRQRELVEKIESKPPYRPVTKLW